MDVCITNKLMQKKHEDVDQEEYIITHDGSMVLLY